MVSDWAIVDAIYTAERSRSMRAIYPSDCAQRAAPVRHQCGQLAGRDSVRKSPPVRLRKRSKSQNQLHRMFDDDDNCEPLTSAPTLRLRSLPLSALEAVRGPINAQRTSAVAATTVRSTKRVLECGNQEESRDASRAAAFAQTLDANYSSSNQHDDDQLTATRKELSSSAVATVMPSPGRNRRPRSQIECVCAEILSTEQSYVRDLRTLVRNFFVPLQDFALKYTINLGAMSALHTSIRTILHIHNELLRQLGVTDHACAGRAGAASSSIVYDDDELTRVSDDWTGSALSNTAARTPQSPTTTLNASSTVSVAQLAAAFDYTIDFMKVYAVYCASYRCARDELAQLQQTYPGLNALTTQLDEHARRDLRVDIVSLMIKPVQRICRYPLLFRELRKHATTSADVARIERSLAKIERVSAYVNDRVREAQNNARLYELHAMLDPRARVDLLQPSRMLLSEMAVRVVSLDSPRWPSFLLRLRSRRRREQQHRGDLRFSDSFSSSSGASRLSEPLLSPQFASSASFGVLPTSPAGGLTSPLASTSAARPPLLRRSASGGERMQLILLSDVLLMTKKHEDTKLKIKRQLCLACARVATDDDATAHNAWSFTLEAAKVGRCHCHHLTPATLKRSPKRRASLSLALSGDRHGGAQSTPSSSSSPLQRGRSTARASGFFSGSDLASAFRASKRYVVTCESALKRDEFVATLTTAITRCARAPLKPLLLGFPSVSDAAMFPVRFWRLLKPQRSLSPVAEQQLQQCRGHETQRPTAQSCVSGRNGRAHVQLDSESQWRAASSADADVTLVDDARSRRAQRAPIAGSVTGSGHWETL